MGEEELYRTLASVSRHNAALRTSRSINAAYDHLACVGEIVGLPKLGFVDNVLNDRPLLIGRGRSLQHDVIGWCPKMLSWWYEQRIFLNHPDVRHAKSTMMPFMSRVQDARPCELSRQENEIRSLLSDAGLASELLIPVHLPRGGVSIVAWSSEEARAGDAVPDEVRLSMMATAYAFVDLIEKQRVGQEPRTTLLTARQRECLSLITQGSSVKEVAIALKLSPHTVQDYLKAAARRLGARSRSHLLSMALSRGELDETITCH
ncbi:LuxR C-terminal-related transcriptional regulator [Novosphingopyxis sp.]|uniref:helix-turn-helix transcriptional regulator n=1 Tax=Novosphingopyxis sp. TaxID=2709690 RepID=UPI003B5BD2D3